MNKSKYLTVFTVATHWFLPRADADEVVDDYRELFEEAPCAEDKLTDKYGSPMHAALALVRPAEYWRWVAVFGALAICLILPMVTLFTRAHYPTCASVLLILGSLIAFLWFRRGKKEQRPLPKAIPICLLLFFLIAGSVIGAMVWSLVNHDSQFISMLSRISRLGILFSRILMGLGVLSALFGMVGLIQARISDARWRALFVLGLTALAMCSLVLSVMHNMDVNHVTLEVGLPMLYRCLLTTLVGLGLTGVCLC